jgi:polyphosphate kinase
MFTANDLIGEDATAVFNMLSGYSEPPTWEKLAVAPIWLKTKFLEWIERETKHAKEGKPARIVAKMNSLCDTDVICALYEASCAGVKIQLIVRGICCLIAGRPGVSENIEVRSIVGTFLEHGRIFYFYNEGHEEIYMGSADWMPRNLERRVEIVFPVEDEDLKERVKGILKIQLADTLKAHILKEDGTYEKVDRRGKEKLESQMYFCEEAMRRCQRKEEMKKRVFEPIEAVELNGQSDNII